MPGQTTYAAGHLDDLRDSVDPWQALLRASVHWREMVGGQGGHVRRSPRLVLLFHWRAATLTRTHPGAAHVPSETGGKRRALILGQLVNHGLGRGAARACGSVAKPAKPAGRGHLGPYVACPRIESCDDGIHRENRICGAAQYTPTSGMHLNALGCPTGRRPLPRTGSSMTSPATFLVVCVSSEHLGTAGLGDSCSPWPLPRTTHPEVYGRRAVQD